MGFLGLLEDLKLRGGGSGLSISKTRFRPMGWGDGLDMYQQL